MPTELSNMVVESPELSREELQRYSRHLTLPEVGLRGQRKLKAARVLLVGAGGLGSPQALYLAAAGVGTLGVVDFDLVDFSNLQRQVLHDTNNVGTPKTESARQRINAINPDVQVIGHEARLTSANALDVLRDYEVVVDGADNFPTRYLVNDACVLLGKPDVYGAIHRFEGQASVFDANRGPCYRCIFPQPPPPGSVPSCAEGGVLGVLPGVIGMLQATEVIKLILGSGEPLIGRLLLFDALEMRFRELKLRKDPACPICGPKRTITELIDYDQFCGVTAESRDSNMSVEKKYYFDITPTELKAKYDRSDQFELLDVRNPDEIEFVTLKNTIEIPVQELPQRVNELKDKMEAEIVVYCRSGRRSAEAVKLLREHGYMKSWNLQGGINAWADEIDPSLPKY